MRTPHRPLVAECKALQSIEKARSRRQWCKRETPDALTQTADAQDARNQGGGIQGPVTMAWTRTKTETDVLQDRLVHIYLGLTHPYRLRTPHRSMAMGPREALNASWRRHMGDGWGVWLWDGQCSQTGIICDSPRLRLVSPNESPQRPLVHFRKGLGMASLASASSFRPCSSGVRSVGCVGARYGVRSVVAATVGEHMLTGTVDGSTLPFDRGSSRLR
jgi:hypothetical protein